jgi:hypothetical protein
MQNLASRSSKISRERVHIRPQLLAKDGVQPIRNSAGFGVLEGAKKTCSRKAPT